MSLINCPECGKQVSDTAISCPNCGHPLIDEKPYQILPKEQKKNTFLEILVAILLFVVPLAPIGIIIMWAKKVPQKKSVRITATIIFGMFFLFYILTSSNSDNGEKKNVEQTVKTM